MKANNRTRRVPWRTVRSVLATQAANLPAPSPAAPFWAEFHVRRARGETVASAPGNRPRLRLATPVLQWTPLAAAAAALALAVGGWFAWPALNAHRGVIRSYEVAVPHRAVLILDNPSTQVSILWVEGMDAPANGGSES